MMNRLSFLRILCPILFIVFIFPDLHSQPRGMGLSLGQLPVLVEKNILFSDSSTTCFISFKVHYNNLIFVKNDGKYTSGFTFDIDIINDNKIIDRKSVHKDVEVSSYDSTKSELNFIEGLVKLKLDKDDYIIKPYSSFVNSDQNVPLDTIPIHKKLYLKGQFARPVVVNGSKTVCNNNQEFQPINNVGAIPHSVLSYDLLIPVTGNTLEQLNVKIEQEGKIVLDKVIENYYSSAFNEEECSGKLVLARQIDQKNIRYFHLKGVNTQLKEGMADVIISGKDTTKARFSFPVIWSGKPKTLLNPELAIQVLRAIDSENTVDSLLSFSRKEYDKVLDKYWDDKFPDRKIAFNQLKDEFYKRADYTMKNFGTINNPVGAKSDRGIVYLCYGKPDDVKRFYSSESVVTEIWTYNSLNKKFSFTDKSGLGNYTRDQ
jgi:GWxTD domain-containing protein